MEKRFDSSCKRPCRRPAELAGRIAHHAACFALVASLASCAAIGPHSTRSSAQADPGHRRAPYLGVLAGVRALDEDDFEPVEEQPVFGVETTVPLEAVDADVEVGVSVSSEEDDVFLPGIGNIDAEATLTEVWVGIRKALAPESAITPYVGAGLSIINVDAEVGLGGLAASDDDTSPGIYVHGGLMSDVSEHLRVGVDLRALLATDVEIAGVSGDADHFQAAVFLGYIF